MRNIEYTYDLTGWEPRSWTTSSSSLKQRYYTPWDEEDSLWDDEDSLTKVLENIKWKFDEPFDPYSDFVEIRSGKPAPKAPKLPDSYPKGDLDNLLGFGSEGE